MSVTSSLSWIGFFVCVCFDATNPNPNPNPRHRWRRIQICTHFEMIEFDLEKLLRSTLPANSDSLCMYVCVINEAVENVCEKNRNKHVHFDGFTSALFRLHCEQRYLFWHFANISTQVVHYKWFDLICIDFHIRSVEKVENMQNQRNEYKSTLWRRVSESEKEWYDEI